MKVRVKLYATLREHAPKGSGIGEEFIIEVDDGTISGVLSALGISDELAKIIMVNGVRVLNTNTKLSENDLVVIFPPVGGG